MKVAFGITVNPGTALLRWEDTQKFQDFCLNGKGRQRYAALGRIPQRVLP